MEEMFTKHVKTLQMCKSCTEETKASDLIIEANPICESYCKNCYKNKELYAPCIEDRQISKDMQKMYRTRSTMYQKSCFSNNNRL